MIARIHLTASVHCEVTSIRARYFRGRICYSVVDGIESEWGVQFLTTPRWSELPLTLWELVNLIKATVGVLLVKPKHAHPNVVLSRTTPPVFSAS